MSVAVAVAVTSSVHSGRCLLHSRGTAKWRRPRGRHGHTTATATAADAAARRLVISRTFDTRNGSVVLIDH